MHNASSPLSILIDLQGTFNSGKPIQLSQLSKGLFVRYEELPTGRQFLFIKMQGIDIQSLAIFSFAQLINWNECYSLGYAVAEKYRNSGLATGIVKSGLNYLSSDLLKNGHDRFYLDAVVGQNNFASIKVAQKIFSGSPKKMPDFYSNTPSLYFRELFEISKNHPDQ